MKKGLYIYTLLCATLCAWQAPLRTKVPSIVWSIVHSHAVQVVLATLAIASIVLIPEDVVASPEGWPVFQIDNKDLRSIMLLWGSWTSYKLYREEEKQSANLYKTLWKTFSKRSHETHITI